MYSRRVQPALEETACSRQVSARVCSASARNDRIELVLFLIPLHEARALQGLSLEVVAPLYGPLPVRTVRHTPGRGLTATHLHLLEIEGGFSRGSWLMRPAAQAS